MALVGIHSTQVFQTVFKPNTYMLEVTRLKMENLDKAHTYIIVFGRSSNILQEYIKNSKEVNILYMSEPAFNNYPIHREETTKPLVCCVFELVDTPVEQDSTV